MAYKEVKLEKGQAKDLYELWNAAMDKPSKPAKKTPAKKPTTGAKKK